MNMSGQKTSARSTRLRSLFTSVLHGGRTIEDKSASLFLEAVRDQDDRALCIQKLQASQNGRAAFQSALTSSTQLAFIQGSVTATLHYLAAPELNMLCGGSVMQQMILRFANAELAWNAFVVAFKSGQLQEDGEVVFSWLILEFLSLPKEKATAFVHLAQDTSIKKMLMKSRKQEVRLRAQRIAHIAENLTANPSSLLSVVGRPGGRHDNDFAEISKIAILPTADELSAKDPYLPRAHEIRTLAQRPDGLAYHLDSQFRLLREDMLRDMREEILMALKKQKGQRRALSVDHLSMAGVHCDGRSRWALRLQCMNDLPQMPKKSESIRKQYLKDNPKYLKHESLACIIADNEVLSLGTLIREVDLLAKKLPVLCLQIPGANSQTMLHSIKQAKDVRLVQLSTALFSYAPILRQLREIKELPFEDEILRCEAESKLEPPRHLLTPSAEVMVGNLRRNPSFDLRGDLQLPSAVSLDKSQRECFIAGMVSRLVTIQGPPGQSTPNNHVWPFIMARRNRKVVHWGINCQSCFSPF